MNINGRKVISYFGITKSHFIHDNRSHQSSVGYLNALAWLVGDLSKPFHYRMGILAKIKTTSRCPDLITSKANVNISPNDKFTFMNHKKPASIHLRVFNLKLKLDLEQTVHTI